MSHIQNYWKHGGLVLLPNLAVIDQKGSTSIPVIDEFKIVSLRDWVVDAKGTGFRDIPSDVIGSLCMRFEELPDKPRKLDLLSCLIRKGNVIAFIPWGNMVFIWNHRDGKWVTRKDAEAKLGSWKLHVSIIQKYLSDLRDSPEAYMPGKKKSFLEKVGK